MRLIRLLVSLLVWLCLAASYSYAADIPAATCSQAHVQEAINVAKNEDRVFVPPGLCTWNSSVTIQGKSLVLKGAGVGSTVITDAVSSGGAIRIVVSPSVLVRVTGFTFDAGGIDKTGSNATIVVTGSGRDRFRIDHNAFQNLGDRGITVDMGGNELSGLIDHNSFAAPFDLSVQGVFVNGAPAVFSKGVQTADTTGNRPFSRPLELGSNASVYIEENTFDFRIFANDGINDGSGGARYVLRHNTILGGAESGHHGADSGGFRGVHSFEIYENHWDMTVCPYCSATRRLIFLRSGVGVIFNNSWTGIGRSEATNFRSCGNTVLAFPLCNGFQSIDENLPGGEGYACLDQVGHLFTENLDGLNRIEPVYFWGNREAGNIEKIDVTQAPNGCDRLRTKHILENREFYNETVAFDGTKGVGVGLLSARPSTCMPFVGYWATDTNTLYRCSATNTWSLHYTPFTYPHPMQSRSWFRPPAPTNLRAGS